MNTNFFSRRACVAAAFVLFFAAGARGRQTPAPQPPPARDEPPRLQIPPEVLERLRLFGSIVSPEVGADRRVTFRLLAPEASEASIEGEWEAGFPPPGRPMTKDAKGVWSVTLGPLAPGAYRYAFKVGGAQVLDPRNTATSEGVNTVRSVVEVPGPEAEFYAVKPVPHGSVSAVWYHSKTLGRPRRMHVYTPPGYEAGAGRHPVLYLLHGAGDSDDSWTSVGRAHLILDNLLAEGKTRPMIVVMPAGHTSGLLDWGPGTLDTRQFEAEFRQDIVPYVEAHYRVLAAREHRAIAGLSMGGMQTLNISLTDLNRYAYVGVFSSGWILPPLLDAFERQHAALLDDAEARKGLRLFWFGTGKADFLLERTRASVEMLKRHKFAPEYQETPGGHTWEVWRDYLRTFAPRLFR
jgi:enterochelin esterase family protein